MFNSLKVVLRMVTKLRILIGIVSESLVLAKLLFTLLIPAFFNMERISIVNKVVASVPVPTGLLFMLFV